MDSTTRRYRHGNLPTALVAAARKILDENGLQAAGLRETARRVGVSATAAYRHFASKEDLLAAVAAEGFRELRAAIETSSRGAHPLIRGGVAYVEFAQRNPGLFRLMFGPVIAERAKYPALDAAAGSVSEFLWRAVAEFDQRPREDNVTATAAWSIVHGLANLTVDGFVPPARGRMLVEEILARTQLPGPPASQQSR